MRYPIDDEHFQANYSMQASCSPECAVLIKFHAW
jgi:hypothetical protein